MLQTRLMSALFFVTVTDTIKKTHHVTLSLLSKLSESDVALISMIRASPRLPSGVLFTAWDNVNRNVQMYVKSKNFSMAVGISNE